MYSSMYCTSAFIPTLPARRCKLRYAHAKSTELVHRKVKCPSLLIVSILPLLQQNPIAQTRDMAV